MHAVAPAPIDAVQHLVRQLTWLVYAAAVSAGVCWCCNADARAAWTRIGPPPRLERGPRDEIADLAAQGIREIEELLEILAEAPAERRRPDPLD